MHFFKYSTRICRLCRKPRKSSALPSEENYQVCLHTYIGSEVAQSQGNSGLAEKVSQGEEGVVANVLAESKQNIPAM